MPNPYGGRAPDYILQEVVDAYNRVGEKAKAARELGMPEATFVGRLKNAARRGMLGTQPVLPGFEIAKETAVYDKDGEIVREFVQQKPEAGPQYQPPAGHIVKGISSLVRGDGSVIQQWIKTREDNLTNDIISTCKSAFADIPPCPLIQPPENTDAELLTVYPIGDQHMGLHAWGRQAGEDYDLEIGAKRLRTCLQRVVSQSPPSRTGILLNLGDWQHTDDDRNVTPEHGNHLDVDNRYQKILKTGVLLMADAVQLGLAKHKNMIVRNLPGNHDPHASVALTLALACLFKDNPRVYIDECPSEFFWHRHGKVLFGATHGHRLRPEAMAIALASRCRADWGETDYHYFYFGHIHNESAKEVGDVRVESFQTLAAKDAWSNAKGFSSGQSITAIHHHDIEGEIGRHRINLPNPFTKRANRSA